MTVNQVFGFMKKMAEREIHSCAQTYSGMNYYKNLGYSFNCVDSDMIASKEGEVFIAFKFGGLKEFIENEEDI